ncbi:hypothetical protein [Ornithinimicrobium kibberense]|uniref:hypothetical protein n=1 Tax=Ornithinimicrobium kibberense TaxID=282060 RepID=UPI0036211771
MTVREVAEGERLAAPVAGAAGPAATDGVETPGAAPARSAATRAPDRTGRFIATPGTWEDGQRPKLDVR